MIHAATKNKEFGLNVNFVPFLLFSPSLGRILLLLDIGYFLVVVVVPEKIEFKRKIVIDFYTKPKHRNHNMSPGNVFENLNAEFWSYTNTNINKYTKIYRRQVYISLYILHLYIFLYIFYLSLYRKIYCFILLFTIEILIFGVVLCFVCCFVVLKAHFFNGYAVSNIHLGMLYLRYFKMPHRY